MPIFYQGINDLFQPLLLFGILLTLIQYSGSQISNQRQTILRRMLSESKLVLSILAVFLGLYIMFKLVMTVTGWVFISCNITDTIWGQQIPSIDYQMGIGASIILLAFLSILIVTPIKHIRGKKSTDSEDIGVINAEIRAQLKKTGKKNKW